MTDRQCDSFIGDVDVREVLRYAGVKNADLCGEDIRQSALRAIREVGETASPRHIACECMLLTEENCCVIDGISIVSRDLAAHLQGCEKVLLFAATLGSSVDLLIARYSAVRMSYAVLLQAAAAAMTEQYCDNVCQTLEASYQKEGCWLKPRYSPGYGDFSLESQTILLDRLNAYKYAGITVSGGGQMTPMKSVSAVIGITRQRQRGQNGSCASGKCANCSHTTCAFRRT